MTDVLDQIAEEVRLYLALRRFQDDRKHLDQLARLKAWQQERMRGTYADMLADERTHELVEYFLQDIYGGLDLSEASASLQRSLRVANRLVTNLDLVRLPLTFNRINAEIDQGLTEIIFERHGHREVTEANYVQACCDLDRADDQFRTLNLIIEFIDGLGTAVHSWKVYRGFKLAKTPARLARLGQIYDVMDRGFETLRNVPNAQDLIHEIVAHEKKILEGIQEGRTSPFVSFSQ